jgi:hypothetical protein
MFNAACCKTLGFCAEWGDFANALLTNFARRPIVRECAIADSLMLRVKAPAPSPTRFTGWVNWDCSSNDSNNAVTIYVAGSDFTTLPPRAPHFADNSIRCLPVAANSEQDGIYLASTLGPIVRVGEREPRFEPPAAFLFSAQRF